MKSRLEVKVKNTIHALDSLLVSFLSSAVFFINLFIFVGFSAYDLLLSFSSRLFYLFYTLLRFVFLILRCSFSSIQNISYECRDFVWISNEKNMHFFYVILWILFICAAAAATTTQILLAHINSFLL